MPVGCRATWLQMGEGDVRCIARPCRQFDVTCGGGGWRTRLPACPRLLESAAPEGGFPVEASASIHQNLTMTPRPSFTTLLQVNRIRQSLALIARNSSAFGLVQPHLERTRLCQLGDSQLDPHYVAQRAQLQALVTRLAHPKVCCNHCPPHSCHPSNTERPTETAAVGCDAAEEGLSILHQLPKAAGAADVSRASRRQRCDDRSDPMCRFLPCLWLAQHTPRVSDRPMIGCR